MCAREKSLLCLSSLSIFSFSDLVGVGGSLRSPSADASPTVVVWPQERTDGQDNAAAAAESGWMDGKKEESFPSLCFWLFFFRSFERQSIIGDVDQYSRSAPSSIGPTDGPTQQWQREQDDVSLTRETTLRLFQPDTFLCGGLDWTDPVVAAASSAQMQKGLSLQNCFELGSVNLRKSAKPIWNLLS